MSIQEVLASYEHIELTQEEVMEALIWRKQKKEAELKEKEQKLRAQETRKRFVDTKWSPEQTRDYMLYRSKLIFETPFVLDESNGAVFDLLCAYFSNHPSFVSLATGLGINNPSLSKGIILCGNFGVGKSWLMKLFMKNQRQVYFMHSAKELASQYKVLGDEALEPFATLYKNAFEDPSVFYQKFSGICIDDMGSEDVKGNFGDKKNVIGDLIEMRYHKQLMGAWFHATTNLTAKQIGEYYGGRVVSRLRETVNFIELRGDDRRK